tara:strand:+ start:901 stop:1155 length:255 start_codon:yes stop_codon:yes gene_type:complete
MPYHSTKKQMEKTKKTDRSKILKTSSTGRRRMTDKEKKILAEHNKDVKHTKAQRFEMVKAISSSPTKYDTKKKIQDLHKKLFGK